MSRQVFSTAAAFVALVVSPGAALRLVAAENEADVASPHPVVAELVDEGIPLTFGADDPNAETLTVKVTRPLIPPDATADEQRAALASLVGERLLGRYLADKVVAPQVLRIRTEEGLAGRGAIRRLDQYFVAYGDLALVREEGLLKDFMAKEKEEQGPAKFEQYLERRGQGAATEPIDPTKPYTYRYRLPLLDRVMISGLIVGQSLSQPGLLIESAVSDRALLGDSDDPTVWQAIPRRAAGEADLGPPAPYGGLAGYLQVTQLKFQPGALLIECHGVLAEPHGWFDGRNLLASKLPLAARDNMRSFRRKLSAAMKEYEQRKAAGD